jgi:hypothetical protein
MFFTESGGEEEMICKHCGTENKDGTRFCTNCGQPFPKKGNQEEKKNDACPACGSALSPDDAFCPECGNAVKPSVPEGVPVSGSGAETPAPEASAAPAFSSLAGAGGEERATVSSERATAPSRAVYTEDSSSAGMAILGFLVPIAGLILYLVWKDTKPLKARSAGRGALVSVIIGAVIWVIGVVIVWQNLSFYETARIFGYSRGTQTSAGVSEPGQSRTSNESSTNQTGAGLSGSNIAAGSTITWGEYEGQPLEWLVLEIKGGKALLLTKDVIERRTYNDKNESVTWETCTLRKWLNSDFYNSFTAAQKRAVAETAVINEDNSEYGTPGGNDTRDKVFLLSLSEARKYFGSDRERIARYNGEAFRWWLRSPGLYATYAADVYSDGYVYFNGIYVNYDYGGVRPALWVNL